MASVGGGGRVCKPSKSGCVLKAISCGAGFVSPRIGAAPTRVYHGQNMGQDPTTKTSTQPCFTLHARGAKLYKRLPDAGTMRPKLPESCPPPEPSTCWRTNIDNITRPQANKARFSCNWWPICKYALALSGWSGPRESPETVLESPRGSCQGLWCVKMSPS